jgi:hypothetical protein
MKTPSRFKSSTLPIFQRFIGPLLPTTLQPQIQPTCPSESLGNSPRNLAPYEKCKETHKLFQIEPLHFPVSVSTLENLIEWNSLLMQCSAGQTDEEWEQNVWEESILQYSGAVPCENMSQKVSCWDDPFSMMA